MYGLGMDGLESVIAAVIIVVSLAMGTAIVGQFADTQQGLEQEQSVAVGLQGPNQFVDIESGEGYNETVRDSLGNAYYFTGASDSYVESKQSVQYTQGENWSVSVWASVNQSAMSDTRAVVSLNGRLVVYHNGTSNNWVAWYYDEGARQSYEVSVATTSPGNLSNVIVTRNTTTLAIYRNNTQGGTADLSTTSTVESPNASNWHGKEDELRTFGTHLNDSVRQGLVNDPVAYAEPATDRTTRIYFDTQDAPIYFADTRLQTSNVSLVTGHPGDVMDVKNAMNDLAGTSDYVWDTDGPRIKPVESGLLAHQPVAFVDYSYEGGFSNLIDSWTSFVALGALLPLVLIAAALMARVRQMQ